MSKYWPSAHPVIQYQIDIDLKFGVLLFEWNHTYNTYDKYGNTG